jgi:hypothetical protein
MVAMVYFCGLRGRDGCASASQGFIDSRRAPGGGRGNEFRGRGPSGRGKCWVPRTGVCMCVVYHIDSIELMTDVEVKYDRFLGGSVIGAVVVVRSSL